MGIRGKKPFVVAAILAAALAGGAYVAVHRNPSPQRVKAHVAAWPERPRAAVTVLTERYGPPQTLAAGSATWRGRAPWKRITVNGDSSGRFLVHTVSYRVPLSAVAALHAFGHGVRVDRDADELSAAGDDEPRNRLALNLAVQLAAGERTPGEARKFYDDTLRLSASGKSSPYLTELLFAPFQPAREDRRRRGVGYY